MDDSPQKTRFHQQNRTTISEFGVSSVLSEEQDEDLLWLLLYTEFCAWSLERLKSVQPCIQAISFEDFVEEGKQRENITMLLDDLSKIDAEIEIIKDQEPPNRQAVPGGTQREVSTTVDKHRRVLAHRQ